MCEHSTTAMANNKPHHPKEPNICQPEVGLAELMHGFGPGETL
jgi:hypothetical protein